MAKYVFTENDENAIKLFGIKRDHYRFLTAVALKFDVEPYVIYEEIYGEKVDSDSKKGKIRRILNNRAYRSYISYIREKNSLKVFNRNAFDRERMRLYQMASNDRLAQVVDGDGNMHCKLVLADLKTSKELLNELEERLEVQNEDINDDLLELESDNKDKKVLTSGDKQLLKSVFGDV